LQQYKQLTWEEAGEKMKRRRSNATEYERCMMQSAKHGPAALGSDLNTNFYVNAKAVGGVSNEKSPWTYY
jgi:hypothetical protein